MKKILLSIAILLAVGVTNSAEVMEDPFNQLPLELIKAILEKAGKGKTVEEYIKSMLNLGAMDMPWKQLITPELIGQSLKQEIAEGLFIQGQLNPPLIKAAKTGDIAMARALLIAGAPLDQQNIWGSTALIEAAENDNLDIATLLIENGANVNAQNKNGQTALMEAVEKCNLDMARLLIENGANVNAQNEDGFTPLMKAVLERRKDIGKLLIENGANVETKSYYGQTALGLATSEDFDNGDMVNLLKKTGARK